MSEEDARTTNLSTQNVVDSTTVTSLNQLSEVYDRLCVVSFILLEVYKLLYTTYSTYICSMYVGMSFCVYVEIYLCMYVCMYVTLFL